MSTHKPKGTYADYQAYIQDPKNNPIDDKKFVFELVHTATDASLKDPNGKVVPFPIAVPLPMSGGIIFKNPDGRSYPRRIRYVEGLQTIFVDEQKDSRGNEIEKPKTVLAEFVQGRKEIDGTNTVMLDFFMNWDINGTKANRDTAKPAKFHLVDTSKLAKVGREKDKQEFDALNWCWTAPINKIMAVSTLVMNHEQLMQNVEDIRYNLVQAAKRNPGKLLELMNDPKTEKNYIIRQAIERKILMVNTSLNAICYPTNPNAPLSVADAGKDPVIDFVYKTLTSVDAQKYYIDIVNAVTSPEVQVSSIPYVAPAPVAAIPYVAPVQVATDPNWINAELKALYALGLERNIIVQKKPYWKQYKGLSAKDEHGFIEKLKENPSLLNLLRADLEPVTA